MSDAAPLSSLELRWFLPGSVSEYPGLKHWFETTSWFGQTPAAPRWRGRMGDEPDRYLVLPGARDMGIKWREGELQIKGRAAALDPKTFAGGHTGEVEHWIKWSYPDLPRVWHTLFDEGTLPVMAVAKSRALRKCCFDGAAGVPAEVPEDTFCERGLGIELTEVTVNGECWSTLGFEAFPVDVEMPGHFTAAVEAVLGTIEDMVLQQGQCLSYPGWLQSRLEVRR